MSIEAADSAERADTVTPVSDIPRISRDDAEALAVGAYERLIDLLQRLDPEDWTRPTDCTGWDVAAMTGHVIGAAKSGASLRQALRQQLHGMRHRRNFGGNALDAVNDQQVREHADLTPAQRLAELSRCWPAAVRGRMRTPRLVRRIDVPMDPGGSTPAGTPTTINLGHLMEVVYTRDVWLHRVDIARATHRELDVDSDVDRRVVADVVAEWADRHGQPFHLRLTGPAGGTFTQGSAGPRHELDAVEFCRILSGRAEGHGLLAQRVLF